MATGRAARPKYGGERERERAQKTTADIQRQRCHGRLAASTWGLFMLVWWQAGVVAAGAAAIAFFFGLWYLMGLVEMVANPIRVAALLSGATRRTT